MKILSFLVQSFPRSGILTISSKSYKPRGASRAVSPLRFTSLDLGLPAGALAALNRQCFTC